jgi:dGTPase
MNAPLAPYATHWRDSRGRLHPEPGSANRTPFQRDRDRIVHCAAFRRLMHKTQVFVSPEGDHFRTRLTHSLEVAQIARSIARTLALDEDLTECLALAHDLGHTPFGHSGEVALNELMQPYGGFDHNDQTLRVLVKLERRYVGFDGLNLTWETLEGVVKHNGPLAGDGLPPPTPAIAAYNARHDLDLASFPGPEAQVAALADDIAYNHHDLDDGLRAELFGISDLDKVPHVAEKFREVTERFADIERTRLVHEAVRGLIGDAIHDVLRETRRRLDQAGPASVADIRGLGGAIVAFSGRMRENDRALKDFLFKNMYRRGSVHQQSTQAAATLRELFAMLLEAPVLLPREWRSAAKGLEKPAAARLVADYVAGMTDRYALQLHARLKEEKRNTA